MNELENSLSEIEKLSRELTSIDLEGYELIWDDINIVLGIASDNRINDRIINSFMMVWLKSSIPEGGPTVCDSYTLTMFLLIKESESCAKIRALGAFQRLVKNPATIMPVLVGKEILGGTTDHWVLILFRDITPTGSETKRYIIESYDSFITPNDASGNYIVSIFQLINLHLNNSFELIHIRRNSFQQKELECGWYVMINAISIVKDCSLFEFSCIQRDLRYYLVNYYLGFVERN